MREAIQNGKFVELAYKVTDRKSGKIFSGVEFPLGYVHGHNDVLGASVHTELQGRFAGDVIAQAKTNAKPKAQTKAKLKAKA